MPLGHSLTLIVFLALSPSSFALGQGACGSLNVLCRDQKGAPALTADPTIQIQSPDASALAPMPEAAPLGPSASNKLTMPLPVGNDTLFSVPERKNAIIDPFGPESGQPLRVSPSPQ